VLNGISFTAAPGQVTAIVGSTGSGKTTLINLIPRFYDVTGGSVLRRRRRRARDGPAGPVAQDRLVPQKAFLFSGTVADNLRYGDEEASDEELWHFLEIAQGTDFVVRDARAARGADRPGRRQRLGRPAPAPRHRPGAGQEGPDIQIFDDSFSALDFTTDARLRAALKKETADATVIIVAQRVGTIMHADQIIVLEDGTIAGMGTHEELLKTSETYREIVESQLGVEGVA
jgi:ATP-binding cassette subfamily B multidrug efflux pump